MRGFDRARRTKVEGRMGKVKNVEVPCKGEITGEMIKVKVIWWYTGSGGCVIWPLMVVLCQNLDVCCDCSAVQG